MDDKQLLKELHHFVKKDLPDLIEGDTSSWQTLDIDYEPPRVERIWFPHKDYRVNLHRIHPCESALYHPHPWPSAIHLLSGSYISILGTDSVRVSTQRLVEGSSYVMNDPEGWHIVRPEHHPALTVMLTWEPYYPPVYDHGNFGKKADLKPLTEEAKQDLLADFKHLIREYPERFR